MKSNKNLILLGTITIGTLFTITATTFSWFSTMFNFETGVTGSSISNYYASGTGTENDPYIIKTPKHMYNLSWLQNIGQYTEKTYFTLDNDIDMAGSLTGFDDVTTGAIPPIGTDSYPFVGVFDGNGKTISNLWVSSDFNDWKEKPLSIETVNVGASIGLFGNIGNIPIDENTSLIGNVNSFYLENIEVTSKVNDGIVGIVAGFADGYLHSIGVKNPKISLGTTEIHVRSDYSLIGEIGPNVTWQDSPGSPAGGDLIIDPNRPDQKFVALTSGTKPVEESAVDTAYYISSLTIKQINGGVSNVFYKFNSTVVVSPGPGHQFISANQNNVFTLNQNNYEGFVTPDFVDRYYAPTTDRTVYFGTTAPSFNNTINLTLSDGTVIPVPRNSVWFKPPRAGVSGLTFLRQSQAQGGESISVYHYLRNGSSITNFGETRFQIDRISNKAAVYFDFEIPQSMVDDGYEFLIAASSTNAATTSGFFYISLFESDGQGGPSAGEIYSVDYVYRLDNGLFEDVTIEGYIPKRTLLTFNGTYSGTICYNMIDEPDDDGNVYYAIKSGNIVIQDLVNNSIGVLTTYNSTLFPDRIDIL